MAVKKYYVSVENTEDKTPFFSVEASSVEEAAEEAARQWDEKDKNYSFSLENKVTEVIVQNPDDASQTYRLLVHCTMRPFYTIYKG